MEAVPRLPMLCFELKSNPQKNAEFGPDIMNVSYQLTIDDRHCTLNELILYILYAVDKN